MESTWSPHGVHMESTWSPHGVHMESTWSPHGVYGGDLDVHLFLLFLFHRTLDLRFWKSWKLLSFFAKVSNALPWIPQGQLATGGIVHVLDSSSPAHEALAAQCLACCSAKLKLDLSLSLCGTSFCWCTASKPLAREHALENRGARCENYWMSLDDFVAYLAMNHAESLVCVCVCVLWEDLHAACTRMEPPNSKHLTSVFPVLHSSTKSIDQCALSTTSAIFPLCNKPCHLIVTDTCSSNRGYCICYSPKRSRF